MVIYQKTNYIRIHHVSLIIIFFMIFLEEFEKYYNHFIIYLSLLIIKRSIIVFIIAYIFIIIIFVFWFNLILDGGLVLSLINKRFFNFLIRTLRSIRFRLLLNRMFSLICLLIIIYLFIVNFLIRTFCSLSFMSFLLIKVGLLLNLWIKFISLFIYFGLRLLSIFI